MNKDVYELISKYEERLAMVKKGTQYYDILFGVINDLKELDR